MSSAPVNKKKERSRLVTLAIVIPIAVVVLLAVVFFAQWLRTLPAVQDFLTQYPGESHLPENAPVGFPAWLAWQHFLNAFLMVLIIRSGWMVRTNQRPAAFWTRRNTGIFKTKGTPKKVTLDVWLHQSLDILWVTNGVIFMILLFVSGQWMRIVPTSWDVIPNAMSAALQYLSMDWPVENGWVNYNGLQLLAYFTTVFIAAPLAIATGFRLSGLWPQRAERLSKLYPIEVARKIHFPVMLYFVLFIVAHVTLVFATGAIRNLNHMYAAQDSDTSLLGLAFFAGSVVLTAAAWVLARPLFLRPIAQLTGNVTAR